MAIATRDLAKQIITDCIGLTSLDETEEAIYSRLLLFLTDYTEGSGVASGPRQKDFQYARANGYFWLPCIICGEWFGGHECGRGGVKLAISDGAVICKNPECDAEAKRINAKYPGGLRRGDH